MINVIRKFRGTFIALFLTFGLLAGGVTAAQGAAGLYTPDHSWRFSSTIVGTGGVDIDTASGLAKGFTPGQILSYRVVDSDGVVIGQTSMVIGESGSIEFEGQTPGEVLSFEMLSGAWTFSTQVVPGPVVPPAPVQSATIAIDAATGSATVSLVGNGSYHILVYGDLTRPADVVTGGSLVVNLGPGLAPGTPIQVNVYGDGSGSGQRLADAVMTVSPPVDNSTTKKVAFCHATSNRAESYVLIETSVAALFHAGHGDHEGDIVPPFTYVDKGTEVNYPGHRWDDAGIAVYSNGCTVIPVSKPEPTETETAKPEPAETNTADPVPTETEEAKPQPTQITTETTTVVSGVTSAKSQAPVEAREAGKNPGFYVETAAPSETDTSLSSALIGGAGIMFLFALFFFRREAGRMTSRRH